jgi:hypothetical protein
VLAAQSDHGPRESEEVAPKGYGLLGRVLMRVAPVVRRNALCSDLSSHRSRDRPEEFSPVAQSLHRRAFGVGCAAGRHGRGRRKCRGEDSTFQSDFSLSKPEVPGALLWTYPGCATSCRDNYRLSLAQPACCPEVEVREHSHRPPGLSFPCLVQADIFSARYRI